MLAKHVSMLLAPVRTRSTPHLPLVSLKGKRAYRAGCRCKTYTRDLEVRTSDENTRDRQTTTFSIAHAVSLETDGAYNSLTLSRNVARARGAIY